MSQKNFQKSTLKSRIFRHFCKLKWSLLQWRQLAILDNNKKLSYCWETAPRECLPKIAENRNGRGNDKLG